jgi:glutamate synthase domain-containing protein 1
MAQVFVGRNSSLKDEAAFERKLYVIRKVAEQRIRYGNIFTGGKWFYVSSLSARTLTYKGMLMSEQVEKYYRRPCAIPPVTTAIALVHSRFSTNTFPSWDRAHPNRCIAHNGEINTLRGNVNWMKARQALFTSKIFGDDIKKILPVINTDGSDSAQFDNCVELLDAGRPRTAARDDDDDSRAVGKSREHGRRTPRVLRISFLPDGTVGRPGFDGVHGRQIDRRVPGPQRPAPVALLRHER